MINILQQEAPLLRESAKPVPADWFGGNKLKEIINRMSVALAEHDDGVAIAAPQIGESWQIFAVSKKVVGGKDDLVFINPKITRRSRTSVEMEEGCLSVRFIYGRTKRSGKVSVEAYNWQGEKFTHHGTNLLAQIFQHEIDHLNGILFCDHATNLQEIRPESLEH